MKIAAWQWRYVGDVEWLTPSGGKKLPANVLTRERPIEQRALVPEESAAPAPAVAHYALALTDAAIKDAVTEYLLHRGEQPYRVLRGGSELWETHVPAMKAAFEAVGRLHATAMTAEPVAWFTHVENADGVVWRLAKTGDNTAKYVAVCRGCSADDAAAIVSAHNRSFAAPPSPDTVREALELAEDVLSRAPFSNAIWPNGVHPQTGITKIRDAIAALSTAAVAVNGHVAGGNEPAVMTAVKSIFEPYIDGYRSMAANGTGQVYAASVKADLQINIMPAVLAAVADARKDRKS